MGPWGIWHVRWADAKDDDHVAVEIHWGNGAHGAFIERRSVDELAEHLGHQILGCLDDEDET